jgi:sugar-specific transcriptional regulator TrmB
MDDKETVRRGLQRIGLSKYQAVGYLTILKHGPLAAVDVAQRSDIPGSRVYDVLTDLEHDGYVATFEREDKRYVQAKEPSDIVSILHETGERISKTAEEIEDTWEQRNIVEHEVNLVKETDSVLERARKFIETAERTVDLAVTPPQYLQLRESLATAVADDVIVRVSLEQFSPNRIDSEQPVTALRHRRITGPLLVISDRTYTCFAPNERAVSDYGLVVNDPILSFIFRWYFQLCLWSVGEPLDDSSAEQRTYVSLEAFIQDIYPLWASGAVVPVTVSGTDTDTGEPSEVTGTVSDLLYPNQSVRSGSTPTYSDLAGIVTLVLTDDDGATHEIGGWGAVYEDVEADRIVLHGSKVVLPPPLPHGAVWPPDD